MPVFVYIFHIHKYAGDYLRGNSRFLSVFTFGKNDRLKGLEICGKECFKDFFYLNFCLMSIPRNTYFITKYLAMQQTKHIKNEKPQTVMQTQRRLAQ